MVVKVVNLKICHNRRSFNNTN